MPHTRTDTPLSALHLNFYSLHLSKRLKFSNKRCTFIKWGRFDMQETLQEIRKKKPKMTQASQSKWKKKIVPFDHLLYRTIKLTIQPILVISFILSFKKTRVLGLHSGKNRLMMMDKGKESQIQRQVWKSQLLCSFNNNPLMKALKI